MSIHNDVTADRGWEPRDEICRALRVGRQQRVLSSECVTLPSEAAEAEKVFEKMQFFMRLRGSMCMPSLSLDGSFHIIGKDWLVGGN